MPKATPLMQKLAVAFERSFVPFGSVNEKLAELPAKMTRAQSPAPRHQLAQGIWVDYQADAGVDTTVEPTSGKDGLRLHLKDLGSSPWYSFSYTLPATALHDARYIGQYTKCSSTGPARFQVCLRYHLPDGIFRDVFARDVVMLTGGEQQEDLLFIRLNDKLKHEARGAELLLFFEGRSFDVTLHSTEALLV